MTTSPPYADRVRTLPSAPLTGMLTAAVAYAFSDRGLGTMSAAVGDGDFRTSRAALAERVAVAPQAVGWMRQIHGGEVAVIDAPPTEPPQCDGLVTERAGTAVAVLTADCVPVLFAAPAGVGAAHAGRLGLLAGVVLNTLRCLGRPSEVSVVIGPAIGGCCYEVPAAMAAAVERAVPGTAGRTAWGTPSVDLTHGVVSQLRDAGVERISLAGDCTRCGQDGRWYSHRASTGPEGRSAGRQAGIAVLRGRT